MGDEGWRRLDFEELDGKGMKPLPNRRPISEEVAIENREKIAYRERDKTSKQTQGGDLASWRTVVIA